MARPRQLEEKQIRLIAEALGNSRRYKILRQLGRCDGPVGCAEVRGTMKSISPATLSHHMKELETAGLIESRRAGKCVSYRLRRDVIEAFFARLRADFNAEKPAGLRAGAPRSAARNKSASTSR